MVLEGNWEWQHATDIHYDSAGRFMSTQAQRGAPGDYHLVITRQTFQYFRGNGAADTPPMTYTHQSNAIAFESHVRLTITAITQHILVLHHLGETTTPTAGSLEGRTDTDAYYSR